MVGMVGYKQSKIYFNDNPEIKTHIDSLSTLSKSHYNPNNRNAETVEEMLSRPTTYCFSVATKIASTGNSFLHNFYFDNKDTAKKAHNTVLKKLYNQKTKKYLTKLNKGLKLTTHEQCTLLEEIKQLELIKVRSL